MNNVLSQKNARVYFDTLGCAKNTCDTKQMCKALQNSGFIIEKDVNNANVIVLNTCAFIEMATQESIDTFFEYRNLYKDKKIVVAGCLPSRYKKGLQKSLYEADAFLPCNEEHKLPELICSFGFIPNNTKAENEQQTKTFAYVKISEGCNRKCSYCMIPKIRGKYKSIAYEQIEADVVEEANLGVHEIILVAQDCGMWGQDLKPKLGLEDLLQKLSNKFPNIMFRILYIGPDGVNDNLLDLISKKNNISKYLDIPLQHCNKDLLYAMNRPGDEDSYLKLINKIRKILPECTLRTTFIVGFPGETEKNFDQLCSFVQKAHFDYAGCFEYSNEEGSASAKLKNQIAKSVKYSRTNTLREILDEISLNKLNEKIGKIFTVIIEGIEEGRFYGRAPFQAPDVDGYVYISEYDKQEKINIGDKLNVKIRDVEGYDLVGSIVYNGKN